MPSFEKNNDHFDCPGELIVNHKEQRIVSRDKFKFKSYELIDSSLQPLDTSKGIRKEARAFFPRQYRDLIMHCLECKFLDNGCSDQTKKHLWDLLKGWYLEEQEKESRFKEQQNVVQKKPEIPIPAELLEKQSIQ